MRTSKVMPLFMAQRHKAYKNIPTFNWWVCYKANNPSTCYARLGSLLLLFFLGIASHTICHSEQKSAVRQLFLCSFSLGFTIFKQLINNLLQKRHKNSFIFSPLGTPVADHFSKYTCHWPATFLGTSVYTLQLLCLLKYTHV